MLLDREWLESCSYGLVLHSFHAIVTSSVSLQGSNVTEKKLD